MSRVAFWCCGLVSCFNVVSLYCVLVLCFGNVLTCDVFASCFNGVVLYCVCVTVFVLLCFSFVLVLQCLNLVLNYWV